MKVFVFLVTALLATAAQADELLKINFGAGGVLCDNKKNCNGGIKDIETIDLPLTQDPGDMGPPEGISGTVVKEKDYGVFHVSYSLTIYKWLGGSQMFVSMNVTPHGENQPHSTLIIINNPDLTPKANNQQSVFGSRVDASDGSDFTPGLLFGVAP